MHESNNLLIQENQDLNSDTISPLKPLYSNRSLVWCYPTGKIVQTTAISSDGNYIVSGSKEYTHGYTNSIILFHKSSSTPLWIYNPSGEVFSVAISSNGTFIVAGTGGRDSSIYLFHYSSSTPIWHYKTTDLVFSVAISSDGNFIIAGDKDNRLFLFNNTSSIPIWSKSVSRSVGSVAISSDGNYIVAGCTYSYVYLFERTSSIPLWEYQINDFINSVAISANGSYIAIGGRKSLGSHKIFLFHYSNSTPLWNYTAGSGISSVSISLDGRYVTAGSMSNVLLFSKDNSTPIWTYCSEGSVSSIAISGDGSYIIAGQSVFISNTSSGEVAFFRTNNSVPMWQFSTSERINSVAISSNGSYIVGGGDDENVYLFSTVRTDTKPIILFSDATNPDTDGEFNLIWNTFLNFDWIKIFMSYRYISHINETSIQLAKGRTLPNPYRISNFSGGTYFFILQINNSVYGIITSNCIKVIIEKSWDLNWYRFWGNTREIQGGKGVAIDSENNIYQTGYTTGGPYGLNDNILLKYNRRGDLLWNKTWGTGKNEGGWKVAIDSLNNVYVIDDTSLTKFTTEGTLLWIKSLTFSPMGIAIDSIDNIYLTGYQNDPSDLILVKFSSNGVEAWKKSWGGSNHDQGTDIAIDSLDYIYIAGFSRSFGSGMDDALLLKYHSNGTKIWDVTWGGADMDKAHAVAIDENNIYIGGETRSNVSGIKPFIVKYNNSGVLFWAKIDKVPHTQKYYDMTTDMEGNIYLTGNTYDGIDELFYFSVYNNHGNLSHYDVFGPDYGMNIAFGIAIDSSESVYISGYSSEYYDGVPEVCVLYKFTFKLTPFQLFSNAGLPDDDGNFLLFWSEPKGAEMYSIYGYDKPILEINESLTLISDFITTSSYPINVSKNGTYNYIVLAFNGVGNASSNCLTIYVAMPPISDKGQVISVYNMMLLICFGFWITITLLLYICKKKSTKRKKDYIKF